MRFGHAFYGNIMDNDYDINSLLVETKSNIPKCNGEVIRDPLQFVKLRLNYLILLTSAPKHC